MCGVKGQEGPSGGASVAVHLAFGGLGQFAVLFCHHVLSELLQYRPDVVRVPPSVQRRQCFQVHHPSRSVHSVHVDLGQEAHVRRDIRIPWPTFDFQAVYPVCVHRLLRTDDHACPVG